MGCVEAWGTVMARCDVCGKSLSGWWATRVAAIQEADRARAHRAPVATCAGVRRGVLQRVLCDAPCAWGRARHLAAAGWGGGGVMAGVYCSVWGIATGDVIRTDYGSFGRITGLSAPRYVSQFISVLVIRTWPVLSITYHDGHGRRDDYGINDVRREGDRYFTDQNDEVFIEHAGDGPAQQMALFEDAPAPQPYAFRPGIDYTLDRGVWRCDAHGDFNCVTAHWSQPAWCPICADVASSVLVMPPRRLPGPQTSAAQYELGLRDSMLWRGPR